MPRIIRKRIPQTGPYILTHPNLNPSARILARELGLQKSYEPRLYPPVIRWGNSNEIDDTGRSYTNYNNASVIAIVANKARFSTAMKTIGIPHVEINTGVPEHFPVVIRHSLSGSRGQGIEVVENIQGSMNYVATTGELVHYWTRTYWSYWRDFKFELGVHFFDGNIIKVFKKVYDPEFRGEEVFYEDDEDSPDAYEENEFPIRNSDNGYHFSLVNIEKYPKLIPLVKDFCGKLGMKFGRLDIGWNSAEKKYEIIEANSAPSLSENENTAQLYIENFKKVLGRS